MQPRSVKANTIPVPHGFYGRDGIPDAAKPVLLKQVHGNVCVTLDAYRDDQPEADAAVTDNPDVALAVKTADCVPVLFFAPNNIIGAAHAGWRGALDGVIENTIEAMIRLGAKREDIVAAVGPCIAQKSYEVSAAFAAPFFAESGEAEKFFMAGRAGKYMFDLGGYAAWRLARAGITRVEMTGPDTLPEENGFYSHRRGTLHGFKELGRQLALISLK